MEEQFSLFESGESIAEKCTSIFCGLDSLSLDDKIEEINKIREELHKYSPFRSEPVDFVKWVKNDSVHANDYNPNSVAPPEMELLKVSINADGYTQPIVTMPDQNAFEVVDGFHRHRVGKEDKDVRTRVHGYLPIVQINESRYDKADRIAATIRHNRARGKHSVDAMSDIVIELKRRNWSDERIAKNLGMDQDEILRLCQITGLTELFSDQQFSQAWDVEGAISEADFVELTDDVQSYGEETEDFRTVNTSDPDRIFHTYEKWECHKAGFYAQHPPEGLSKTDCEEEYRKFLSNLPRFELALESVITQWKHSCEHYLTNKKMNRIAWLGQASMCFATGIPSAFRGGFFLLSEAEQEAANKLALIYLNKWLVANNRPEVTMEEAYSGDRQSEIY